MMISEEIEVNYFAHICLILKAKFDDNSLTTFAKQSNFKDLPAIIHKV